MTLAFNHVAVIGAGAMGRGIAQIAAQAGSQVWLYDTQSEAIQKAKDAVFQVWDTLASKGRLDAETVSAYKSRLHSANSLNDLQSCELVVEAIVERLDIKKSLFVDLENLLPESAVLVTNTSSLSVTAIAAALKRPANFAGYHFFNPVPLMKVVEVIAGLKTNAAVCERLTTFATQMGHTPVQANDTPGFIVNHAGRGYGTEALRIVSEGVADFATIDRILKDQVGFKLGPFELFDLTALDVSHPVMESIYNQYYQEPRYRPSVITAQRLAGGVVGKKAGEGFYTYVEGKAVVMPEPPVPDVKEFPPVWVSPRASRRLELLQLLKDLGATIESGASPSPQALTIVAPLGFDVTATKRRVLATNPATRSDMRDAAHALFAKDGKAVSVVRDSGGFVTQRVVANIVNIAADMCQQRVCSPSDLDVAVTLGLGYPVGPLALGNKLGPTNVLEVLFNLQTVYGDPRYRPSPWLRRRGAIGLSLLQTED